MRATRTSLREALPAWYDGRVHAVLHVAFLVAVLVGSLLVTWWTDPRYTVLVPALVPLWSALEYGIHRWVLHGTFLPSLTRDHGLHHTYFADGMAMDDPRDVYRVLQRPQDVVALEAVAFLAAGGASLLAGLPAAAAVAASGNLWFLAYEVAHTAAHASSMQDRPVLGRWFRHHRIHHAPGLGTVANFSTVLPGADRVFRTSFTEVDLERS